MHTAPHPPTPRIDSTGHRQLDATLTGIYFFESAQRRIASLRRHEPAELIILFDGLYTAERPVAAGGETLRAEAGDVIFWPAGAERLEINDPRRPTRCLAIHFNWKPPESLPNRVRDKALIMRLLGLRLLSLHQNPRRYPTAVWNGYLNALLAEYIRLVDIDHSDMVNRVLDYIEHHMADSIELGQLAEAAGLERHHFGRQFKREKGLSPMDYLRRRRVEYALGMLATSESWTVAKIAQRVGIASPVLLRRWMKRYTGINLRALKKMARRHHQHPSFWPAAVLPPLNPAGPVVSPVNSSRRKAPP